MLLKHLYDFAESRRLFDHLPFKPETPVRWIIELDSNGKVIGDGPRETQGAERNKGKEYDVPKTIRPTGGGQVADFLVDDIGAIFALNTKPDKELKPRAVINLKAKHEDFWRQIKEADAATGNPVFKSLLRFHENLGGAAPGFLRLDSTDSPKWMVRQASGGEVRLGNDLFTFAIGGILILDEAVREYWRRIHAQEMAEDEEAAPLGVCLITGKSAVPIARTHTIYGGMVTGLSKPAKGTGAGIVGADKPAFWSYGLQKAATDQADDESDDQRDKNPGYLSPCSIRASKGYLLALQHLSSKKDHWIWLGPAWLCFWAVETEAASNIFAQLLKKPYPERVRKFMKSPWSGLEKPPPETDQFIAVTLTAAGPRIVIKNWLQMPLTSAEKHLKKWFADLAIGSDNAEPQTRAANEDEEFAPLAVSRLAGCTAPLTVKAGRLVPDYEKLQPDIAAQLYRAALEGTAPSISLIKPILDQLHSKLVRNENYQLLYDQSRFALLKLILNRNRKGNTMTIEAKLTANTDDPAYNCGRLLAILAATQEKAFNADKKRGEEWTTANATIVDRYFGTASSSPASVFPLLCRLNRHHLNKIAKSDRFAGQERFIEEQIQAVCALFKPTQPGKPPVFPRTLDLQQQGRFALGFYQQQAEDAAVRQANRKNDDTTNKSETK